MATDNQMRATTDHQANERTVADIVAPILKAAAALEQQCNEILESAEASHADW